METANLIGDTIIQNYLIFILFLPQSVVRDLSLFLMQIFVRGKADLALAMSLSVEEVHQSVQAHKRNQDSATPRYVVSIVSYQFLRRI